jgi:hypothetical protein
MGLSKSDRVLPPRPDGQFWEQDPKVATGTRLRPNFGLGHEANAAWHEGFAEVFRKKATSFQAGLTQGEVDAIPESEIINQVKVCFDGMRRTYKEPPPPAEKGKKSTYPHAVKARRHARKKGVSSRHLAEARQYTH